MKYLLAAILVFTVAGTASAANDEFGARFGNQSASAFGDTAPAEEAMPDVWSIEPAAGDEDSIAPEDQAVEDPTNTTQAENEDGALLETPGTQIDPVLSADEESITD